MAYSTNSQEKKPRKRLSQSKRLELEREREARRRYSQNRDVHLNLFEFVLEPDANNQAAYTIAKSFLEKGTSCYNPVVIYGPSKSGKTHLLKAIAQGLQKKFSEYKIVYMSGEEYYHRFAYAVRNRTYQKFRHMCRSANYFILDDFHLLQNKLKSQEDLRHLLDFFERTGTAVVVGSRVPLDKALAANPKFLAALVSRLQKGASLCLKPVGLNTAVQFCQERAKAYQVEAEDETFRVLWETFPDDFGKFKTMIHRMLKLVATTPERKLTLPMLSSVRARYQNRRSEAINLDKILKTVSDYYGLKSPDLLRQQRGPQSLTEPRYVTIGLSKTILRMKTQELRETFGNRSESSIRYVIKALAKSSKLQETVKKLHNHIVSPIPGPPHELVEMTMAKNVAPPDVSLMPETPPPDVQCLAEITPRVMAMLEIPQPEAVPVAPPVAVAVPLAVPVAIPVAVAVPVTTPQPPQIKTLAKLWKNPFDDLPTDLESVRQRARELVEEFRAAGVDLASLLAAPASDKSQSQPVATPGKRHTEQEELPLTPEEQQAIDELEPPQPENMEPEASAHTLSPMTQTLPVSQPQPAVSTSPAVETGQPPVSTTPAQISTQQSQPEQTVNVGSNEPAKPEPYWPYLFDATVVARVAAWRPMYTWCDDQNEELKWKRLRLLKATIDENKRTSHIVDYPKMDWQIEWEELTKPREPVPQCLGQLFWEWPENPTALISLGRLDKLPDPPPEKGATSNEPGKAPSPTLTNEPGKAPTPSPALTTPWLADATQKSKNEPTSGEAGRSLVEQDVYPPIAANKHPGTERDRSAVTGQTGNTYGQPKYGQATPGKQLAETPPGSNTQPQQQRHLFLHPKIDRTLANLPDIPKQNWRPVEKRKRRLTTEETLPPAVREEMRKKEEEKLRQAEIRQKEWDELLRQRQEELRRQLHEQPKKATSPSPQPATDTDSTAHGMRRAMEIYEKLHTSETVQQAMPTQHIQNTPPATTAGQHPSVQAAQPPDSEETPIFEIPSESCLGHAMNQGMRNAMAMYLKLHARNDFGPKKKE